MNTTAVSTVNLSRDEMAANVHAVFTEIEYLSKRLAEFHSDYVNADTDVKQGIAAADAAGTIRMLARLTPMLDALHEDPRRGEVK